MKNTKTKRMLAVAALLAVILQIIGTRPSAGMTKKQKVMVWRMLTATVLLLILQVLGAGAFEVFGAAGRWIRLAVCLVDYLVIGYDILNIAGLAFYLDAQVILCIYEYDARYDDV